MNISKPATAPVSTLPSVLLTLAQLLERLDNSRRAVDGAQFRLVASRLADELQRATPGASLQAVLAAHPSAAELYENLNYAQAGLCRSSLQAALGAELRTAGLLRRASRKPSLATRG